MVCALEGLLGLLGLPLVPAYLNAPFPLLLHLRFLFFFLSSSFHLHLHLHLNLNHSQWLLTVLLRTLTSYTIQHPEL
jgi:hypothetical protein